MPDICGTHIGPVPKAADAIFVCVEPLGHALPHKSLDGAWWEPPLTPTLHDLRCEAASKEHAKQGHHAAWTHCAPGSTGTCECGDVWMVRRDVYVSNPPGQQS